MSCLPGGLQCYAQYSTAVDPVGNLCCIWRANLVFNMSQGRQIEAGLKQVLAQGRLDGPRGL